MQHQELDGELAGCRLAIEQLVDPDFSGIDARIAAADETNRIANLVKQHAEALANHSASSEYSQHLSDCLTNLKVYKTELIQAAGLPVPGLGFDNGEVTYNGLPLSQASGAEQLEISCAICMAENPQIGILTIDVGWSELDNDSQKVLRQWAEKINAQVWVTKVTEDPEEDGWHIVSGEVVAVNGRFENT